MREAAVFGGLSIAEGNCGVWVVNMRTSQTVALLRFDEGVQEIFAVPSLDYPLPAFALVAVLKKMGKLCG